MVLDAFTALRAAFTKRFESLEARVPDMLHGIVEAVNPVAVRLLDGSLVSGLDTLDPTVKVTDRVRLFAYGGFLTGRRLLVLGKVGAPFQGRLPTSADLDNYVTPGQWHNPLNVEVAGFTNGPPSNAAGSLVVLQTGSGTAIQFWHGFDDDGTGSKIYRRRLYSGSWSAWKLMNPASWVGSVSGGQRSGITFYNVTLTFPAGLFSVAPKVFAQINNQAGGGAQLQVLTGSVTTSSCVVGFFMTTGTMDGHWCEADVFAIEPS